MGRKSMTESLKVIQGGKAEENRKLKTLTHQDIKFFLLKFAEAILVDQARVNKLPRKEFHAYYDHGMWKRNREDHVGAIVGLLMTVDRMPKRLLKRLTELAASYGPEVVRKPLLDNVSDLATGAASPWLYETASLFFSELIKDVNRQGAGRLSQGDPLEIISQWFDYDDPIRISHDPECEYSDLLAAHIEREPKETKQSLVARSRISVIESRVATEFGEYMKDLRD